MARIGIMTCSNTTQELGCSSVFCLMDMRLRRGQFERYRSEDQLELVGIMNCAGCPTAVGHEKLLVRLRGLVEFGIDALHFSTCVHALCPFKEKYAALLQERHPDIEVIFGTHEVPDGLTEEEAIALFREEVACQMARPRPSLVERMQRMAEAEETR